MNDLSRFVPTVRRTIRAAAAASLDFSRRGIALTLIWLLVPLSMAPLAASAQQVPPPPPDQQQGPPPDQQGPGPEDQGPPPQAYNALSPDQLNQLVAPIALYPDSLVAQVLAAATYPTQIVDADRFVQSNQGAPPDQLAQMVNSQPWDPSVKALTAFPTVLANMDRNLDWTTQLGNAYYNQPQDVMSAVQAMRQEAYQRGDLRSTPQQEVTYAPSDIEIAPVNPAVVYVPYYNPWAVWGFRPWYAYYAPAPPPGIVLAAGLGIGFGFGVVIGAWSHWGWGWGHWGMGWGPHPYILHDRAMYISHSYTVVNHGHYGYFDRGPGAREFNAHVAANARAAGYAHGYAAGERNGFNRGGQNYNRGAQNYNRGAQNYNRGAESRPAQNYNRGAQSRPAENYNRGAQNYNRGAQNRPAQNYNRSQNANRGNQHAAPQNRGSSHPASHGNDHPKGGGGGHDSHGSDGHGRR